jgi:hypothetical protein
LRDGTDLVRVDTMLLERADRGVHVLPRNDEHHADAAIERAVHLVTIDVAVALQPVEDREPRPARLLEPRLGSSGSTRGMFSVSPPPVMCAMPFTATFAITASTGFT